MQKLEKFTPGVVVWARFSDRPWWPSLVLDRQVWGPAHDPNNILTPGTSGNRLLSFFSTKLVAVVDVGYIYEFTTKMSMLKRSFGQDRQEVVAACRAAQEHIMKRGIYSQRTLLQSRPYNLAEEKYEDAPIQIGAGVVVWARVCRREWWPSLLQDRECFKECFGENELDFHVVECFDHARGLVKVHYNDVCEFTANMAKIDCAEGFTRNAIAEACKKAERHIRSTGLPQQQRALRRLEKTRAENERAARLAEDIDSDSEDDEQPRRKRRRPASSGKTVVVSDSDDDEIRPVGLTNSDSDSENDGQPRQKRVRTASGRKPPVAPDSDDDEITLAGLPNSDFDCENRGQPRRNRTRVASRRRRIIVPDSDDDDITPGSLPKITWRAKRSTYPSKSGDSTRAFEDRVCRGRGSPKRTRASIPSPSRVVDVAVKRVSDNAEAHPGGEADHEALKDKAEEVFAQCGVYAALGREMRLKRNSLMQMIKALGGSDYSDVTLARANVPAVLRRAASEVRRFSANIAEEVEKLISKWAKKVTSIDPSSRHEDRSDDPLSVRMEQRTEPVANGLERLEDGNPSAPRAASDDAEVAGGQSSQQRRTAVSDRDEDEAGDPSPRTEPRSGANVAGDETDALRSGGAQESPESCGGAGRPHTASDEQRQDETTQPTVQVEQGSRETKTVAKEPGVEGQPKQGTDEVQKLQEITSLTVITMVNSTIVRFLEANKLRKEQSNDEVSEEQFTMNIVLKGRKKKKSETGQVLELKDLRRMRELFLQSTDSTKTE